MEEAKRSKTNGQPKSHQHGIDKLVGSRNSKAAKREHAMYSQCVAKRPPTKGILERQIGKNSRVYNTANNKKQPM